MRTIFVALWEMPDKATTSHTQMIVLLDNISDGITRELNHFSETLCKEKIALFFHGLRPILLDTLTVNSPTLCGLYIHFSDNKNSRSQRFFDQVYLFQRKFYVKLLLVFAGANIV